MGNAKSDNWENSYFILLIDLYLHQKKDEKDVLNNINIFAVFFTYQYSSIL